MSALLKHLDEVMVALRPREEFCPIPRASNREAWHAIRQRTGDIAVQHAEKHVDFAWPVISATDIMLAAVNGDSRSFAPKYEYRRAALSSLALAECIEGKGRFLSDIINLCFMICEETAWTLPVNLTRPDGGHDCLPNIEHPQLDMGAARTGALLATVLYMHREKFREASPLIAIRIEREITLRVIDPFINSKSVRFMRENGEYDPLPEGLLHCLTALLFIERDDRFRWGGVKKALQLLDRYMDSLPGDGGIPGGMGAFESSIGCFMEALSLISTASGGSTSFFTVKGLRSIGDYIVGNHIELDYFNCPGNCPAHLEVDANLIYRCGGLIRSDALCSLGAYLLRLREVGDMNTLPLLRCSQAVLDENEMLRHDSHPPMPMDYYVPSHELLCVRTRTGASEGFFASMEGGANVPGGHADAGNISVFHNGKPVLLDLGEIPYVQGMSVEERAALWETQSQFHNLPVINGYAQGMGLAFRASEPLHELLPERSNATLDISRAYPPESGILSWQRTVSLIRGEVPCIRLWEVAEFEHDANELEFNFITTRKPLLKKSGMYLGDVEMSWEGDFGLEVMELPPNESSAYDPEGLYRKWVLGICGQPIYRVALSIGNVPRRFDMCFTITERHTDD